MCICLLLDGGSCGVYILLIVELAPSVYTSFVTCQQILYIVRTHRNTGNFLVIVALRY